MKKRILKITAVAFVVLLFFYINNRYLNFTPTMIQEWLLSFGVLAPILFVFIYTIRPLILFPASVLSLTGGLAFGAIGGTIYTIIGATLGAALSFLLARKLGGKFIKEPTSEKRKKIQRNLEKNGFLYVLLLRLIPLFNFDLISYVAGVSKVKFRSFFLATLIGIIPGTFAYNFLGSSFTSGDWTVVLIAASVFLVVLIVPLLLKKRLGFMKDFD